MFQQACEVEIALQVWRFAGLAQIQQSGGSGGEIRTACFCRGYVKFRVAR